MEFYAIKISLKVVQPFQGCHIIYHAFRGLPPTIIHIKPFQGSKENKS
jgi:hypothetical protein